MQILTDLHGFLKMPGIIFQKKINISVQSVFIRVPFEKSYNDADLLTSFGEEERWMFKKQIF